MSGHSKWSTIKRAKGLKDAKRGAIFTKLGKLIVIAARGKGGDLDTNFSLRMAVDKAKAANMPKDNIERAIKKGTGEIEGGQIEELVYEGIGPVHSQFVLKILTDNKNRSASEIRHLFSQCGGSFGAVLWNFSQKGVIRISTENIKDTSWGELELELIDAGADDIIKEDEGVTIYTQTEDLQKVKTFLEDKKIETESSEIEYIAKEEQTIAETNKEKFEKFIDELEENGDVSSYYHNISNI